MDLDQSEQREDWQMKNANEQPWWINAHERPPEIGRIMDALVEAGLCDWTSRANPHPQDYALVAWWAINREGQENHA